MTQKKAAHYRELLRSGRWFRGLTPSHQEVILSMARVRELAAGTVLFSRGDPSNGIFGVLDGQLRASGTDEEGRRAVLTMVEPPSWVGEISVFDGLPRTHDLVVEADARVVHVPQEPLLDFLDREPRFWRELAILMASKLRLSFEAIEQGQILSLDVRLARRLVWMADGYGEWSEGVRREVHVSQDTLAQMLSTSRQTVNQLLKAFEMQGWIRLSYGRVEIVDIAALRRSMRS